jgi:hypothetical protein
MPVEDETMKNPARIPTGLVAALWMFLGTHVMGQGSLTPPGAPGETMHTLWPGSPNWSSSYVSPGTRLPDHSFSVRLSQYADLFFRRPEFAFHLSDSFG